MAEYGRPIEYGSANPPPLGKLGRDLLGSPVPAALTASVQAALDDAAEAARSAALEKARHAIDEHRRPDCICHVGVGARFGAQHATACPRFAELHDVDVERADHLAGRGWSSAWTSSCSCGAISAGGYRTAGEARRSLEDTRP